jgi:hypothetical protein
MAFVSTFLDQRQAPAIQPLILDANFSRTTEQRHPLALPSGKRRIGFDGAASNRRAAPQPTPQAADLVGTGIYFRLKPQRLRLASAAQLESAKLRRLTPDPQADVSRRQRLLRIVKLRHHFSIY